LTLVFADAAAPENGQSDATASSMGVAAAQSGTSVDPGNLDHFAPVCTLNLFAPSSRMIILINLLFLCRASATF
jgi:hypothetical protein